MPWDGCEGRVPPLRTSSDRPEDAWHVTCPHCLRFTLDSYILELFESARQRADLRVLRLLPRLSDAARQHGRPRSRFDRDRAP